MRKFTVINGVPHYHCGRCKTMKTREAFTKLKGDVAYRCKACDLLVHAKTGPSPIEERNAIEASERAARVRHYAEQLQRGRIDWIPATVRLTPARSGT